VAEALASIQPIKDLDDALRYLVEELGYEEYPALWEMEARIWDGKLRLMRQKLVDDLPYSPSHYGMPYNVEPVDPSFFCSKLTLRFDRHDRVEVIPRVAGFEWWDFRYRIADGCDVRAIWPHPPASETASAQKPNSAGLDPFRTGAAGRPTAAHLILAEAERRITEKEVTPTLGGLTAFSEDLEKWWAEKRLTFDPHGPPMEAGSIKNVVRELWNAALGVQI
jgi:hypothetical protein